jgi:hypothetical protein
MMHGPKDTMIQEQSLTMSELNVATNILAAHGHSDYDCHQGLSHMEEDGLCLLLSNRFILHKAGASGLYGARITAHNHQDQEGWWRSMQVDSVTTQ